MGVQNITSRENPRIKHIRKLLADKSYRSECGEYVVEGTRSLSAIENIRELYVRAGTSVPENVRAGKIFSVSAPVFELLSSTEHSQGVIAAVPMSLRGSDAISSTGRYVLLDNVQDPGNMGTIIRTAAAFQATGILVTAGCVDPFSPKVVRATAGALSQIDIITLEDVGLLHRYAVIAADKKGNDAGQFEWPGSFILAIGNEAHGVSKDVRSLACSVVTVPVAGRVESLNAAVAAAILLYIAFAKKT